MGEKNPDKKYSGIGILDYSVAAKPGWEETPQQQSAECQEEAKAQHEQLLEEYQADVKDDEKDQYLVDGALLTCNQATWAPFPVPGENDIELVFASEEGKYARKYPFPVGELSVQDDEMSVNNELYATVEDAVKNKNISPFRCNCKIEAYTKAEIEAIKNDPFCNIFGVCRHLMRLSNEWDNLPLSGQFYKTKEIVKDKSAGDGEKDGDDTKETIEVPCITMTSALLCIHGGLITPVTSGQNGMSMEEEIEAAMETVRRYLSMGDVEEELAEEAILYLAQFSDQTVPQYITNTKVNDTKVNNTKEVRDYNRYDRYILGWGVYYKLEMGVEINLDYIKAQLYQESKVGYDTSEVPTTNPERDVMQALDIKNDNIFDYIEITPSQFKAKVSSDVIGADENGYWEASKIRARNKMGDPGSSNPEKTERCGGIVRSLFNTKPDGTGECYYEGSTETYYFQLEKVTPFMSIGLGMDKMQGLIEKYDGDYEKVLLKYNVGCDMDYVSEVMEHVGEEEYEVD